MTDTDVNVARKLRLQMTFQVIEVGFFLARILKHEGPKKFAIAVAEINISELAARAAIKVYKEATTLAGGNQFSQEILKKISHTDSYKHFEFLDIQAESAQFLTDSKQEHNHD